MSETINFLKEKFASSLESAKQMANEVSEKMKSSVTEIETSITEKMEEAKSQVASVQEKMEAKYAEFEANVEAFKAESNAEISKKKAVYAEEYAAACVEMVFAAMQEAENAISNAILAAQEAEELAK